MSDIRIRARGCSFNAVAGAYDRHRPAYPGELLDRVISFAGLQPGDDVLEIGCGTGQLTRSLLQRGLRVTALEPGADLLARARERLHDRDDLHLISAPLETAPLPSARFSAAFSASAIHWVDPDIGWRRTADALVDGGVLALISYFGIEDERSRSDQASLRNILRTVSPRVAAEWPVYRDATLLAAGAHQRRRNISSLWGWVGEYDVERAYVETLFGDAVLETVTRRLEHSAEALNALMGTMSFWSQLNPEQQRELTARINAFGERRGRALRSTTVACAAMARRLPRS